MGKTRKKAEQYEILLSGEFYGAVDSWTEYLCLARNPDGSITPDQPRTPDPGGSRAV